MKKRNINSIDKIVESLSENFSKIENFGVLQQSDEGKKLFDLVVKNISELESFQSLFLNYYIPASNKSIADSWNQLSKSKYKHLLNIKKVDLKENLYETIRLGYVGLFHKYESYLKALIEATNFLLRELNEENKLFSIEEYCKKEFDLNIFKSHHIFPIISRINYISNCIKHYDGYPIKKPIHDDFKFLDQNKRIEIERDSFKLDIDTMKSHCQLLLSQIIIIGFKQFFDSDYEIVKGSIKPEIKDNPETYKKYLEVKKQMDYLLSDFIK